MRYWVLANMSEAALSDESFQFDEGFDLEEFAARSFGVFQEEPIDVALRFAPEVAADAATFLFHPGQETENNDNGSLIVRFTAGGGGQRSLGPDSGIGGSTLGRLRTMRRWPDLLGGNGRRRTPRAMPGTAQTRSIVRLLAGVHRVLIGRDEERRPPVRLRLLSPSGRPLPALRPRQHLLLQGLWRSGAAACAAPCRTALPEQPAGPSQACAAPAALPRTPPAPGAGEAASCAESDASPFDRGAAASCCGGDVGGALGHLRRRAALSGAGARRSRFRRTGASERDCCGPVRK